MGKTWKGHFVAFFREPKSRMVSAWEYFKHGRGDLLKYANKSSHYMTKMLTGEHAHIALALDRLENGFKFIGLTEEWNLSICLFHAMLGGKCLDWEFSKSRPTGYHHDKNQSM